MLGTMTLVSFNFIAFFCLSLAIYYTVPVKYRNYCLIIFSVIFFVFSSRPITIIYLFASIVITSLSVHYILRGKAKNLPALSKIWTIIGVLGNISMLIALKYLGFIITILNSSIIKIVTNNRELLVPQLIAPLGISFYTLSAIGYILDSYWSVCTPTSSLFKNALFISYWPALTSGPIIKYSSVQGELFKEHRFDYEHVCFGIQRMLWGFIKKLVLSARFAIIVDSIYSNTDSYNGMYLWVAAVCFVMQLYTDFSGCMDIILGASECYGICLSENFRAPFFAKSIQEFWQRWHITLGVWFKEYVLYPILNSKIMTSFEKRLKTKYSRKVGRLITSCLGMLFVWILIGLWHGGGWNYLAMGLYFWLLISFEKITISKFDALWEKLKVPVKTTGWKFLKSFKVFILIVIGFVLFRIHSIKTVLYNFKLSLKLNPWIFFDGSFWELGILPRDINILVIGTVALVLVSLFNRSNNVRVSIAKQPLIIRWIIYLALLFIPLIYGIYGPGYDAQVFIYEQF